MSDCVDDQTLLSFGAGTMAGGTVYGVASLLSPAEWESRCALAAALIGMVVAVAVWCAYAFSRAKRRPTCNNRRQAMIGVVLTLATDDLERTEKELTALGYRKREVFVKEGVTDKAQGERQIFALEKKGGIPAQFLVSSYWGRGES